jgi:glycosyltransferase involved in cell wall biosynthesis
MGGVEKALLSLLDKLKQDKSIKLSVISFFSVSEQLFVDYFRQNSADIELITCSKIRNEKANGFLKRLRKSILKKIARMRLRGVLKSFDVIIDYKNAELSGKKLYNILKENHAKKITFIHGSINFFNNNFEIERLDMYDSVVCLSDSFLKDFQMRYPKYANKIRRIYNLLDVEGIRRDGAKLTCPQGKYFLSVSRLDADKDILTIIKAFDLFFQRENRPDIKLYIVGEGPLGGQLQSEAKKLRSGDNVIFTGQIDRPFGYMRSAMAHILSSYNEGCPIVLMENAALGVLSIASNCKSGPSEILMNGNAGILFDCGSFAELSGIMSDVFRKRIDTKKLIENGNQGLSRFHADAIISQIKDLFS